VKSELLLFFFLTAVLLLFVPLVLPVCCLNLGLRLRLGLDWCGYVCRHATLSDVLSIDCYTSKTRGHGHCTLRRGRNFRWMQS
jgi:hypothetical protein